MNKLKKKKLTFAIIQGHFENISLCNTGSIRPNYLGFHKFDYVIFGLPTRNSESRPNVNQSLKVNMIPPQDTCYPNYNNSKVSEMCLC